MTYIGVEDGVKGYCFIRPSGAIFLVATATFDETLFPCCRGASTPGSTNFGNLPPQVQMEDHDHPNGTGNDGDDNDFYHQPPANPSSRSNDLPNHFDPDNQSEHSAHGDAADAPPDSPPVSPQDFAPRRKDQREWHDLPPRQSERNRTIRKYPGNTYGEDCTPSDIAQDIEHMRYWKKAVGQESLGYRPRPHGLQQPVAGPSNAPDPLEKDGSNSNIDEDDMCKSGHSTNHTYNTIHMTHTPPATYTHQRHSPTHQLGAATPAQPPPATCPHGAVTPTTPLGLPNTLPSTHRCAIQQHTHIITCLCTPINTDIAPLMRCLPMRPAKSHTMLDAAFYLHGQSFS